MILFPLSLGCHALPTPSSPTPAQLRIEELWGGETYNDHPHSADEEREAYIKKFSQGPT